MDARASAELSALLRAGAEQLDVPLGHAAIDQLVSYLFLLQRWNRVYNLTGVRGLRDMAIRHVLDSLALLPWVRGSRVLDVGSGAGLPGLVIAMAQPDCEVILVDRSLKRSLFLKQACIDLSLTRASVWRGDVGAFPSDRPLTTITSRAFAGAPAFLDAIRHLLAPGTRVLAMQGRERHDATDALCALGFAPQIVALNVPHLAEARHLVVVDIPPVDNRLE